MAGFTDLRNATATRYFFMLLESASKVGLLVTHPVIQGALDKDPAWRGAKSNAAASRISPLSFFDAGVAADTAEGTILPLATFTSTPVDLATARAGERYELGDQAIARTPEFRILAGMPLDRAPGQAEMGALAYIIKRGFASWMVYFGAKIKALSSTWTPAGGTSGADLTVALWQYAVDLSRQAGHMGPGLGIIDATAQKKLRENALTLGGAAQYTGWAAAFANGAGNSTLYSGDAMYGGVDILVQDGLPPVAADTAGEIIFSEDLNILHDTPALQPGAELIAEIPGLITVERNRGIATGTSTIGLTWWMGVGKAQDTGRKILWKT